MLVNPVQYENAKSLKDVTLLGITVFLQPKIRVLVSVSIIALQSLRESYFGLLWSTTIDEILLHFKNAPLPIDVKLIGTTMNAKLVQSPKAETPIDVTLLGILMDVILVQPEKTKSFIDDILLEIVTDSKLEQ
jgi:hypothetical protein